jgi:predicted ArsR family transcriptional regulator
MIPRLELMRYFKEHKVATSHELMDLLGVERGGVRKKSSEYYRHMRGLEKCGYIVKGTIVKGKGREYHATEKLLKKY